MNYDDPLCDKVMNLLFEGDPQLLGYDQFAALPPEIRDGMLAMSILAASFKYDNWLDRLPRRVSAKENMCVILDRVVRTKIRLTIGPPLWLLDVCRFDDQNDPDGNHPYRRFLRDGLGLWFEAHSAADANKFKEALAYLEEHPASAMTTSA